MTSMVKVPDMQGDLAYPRKNGEPVFDAPWQSRAFGMVVGLHTSGLYPWDDFKTLLIDEIGHDESSSALPDSAAYYYQWMDAFARLLVARSILSEQEILERTQEFKAGDRQEVY